jgi:hypothetical protein
MPCKDEVLETLEGLKHNKYHCKKYGFNSGLKCNKLNQPNCYVERLWLEEEK